MRIFFFLLIFFTGFVVLSQTKPLVQSPLNYEYNKSLYTESNRFTAFKSSFTELQLDSQQGIWNSNLLAWNSVKSNRSRNWMIQLNPAFEFLAGVQNKGDELVTGLGAGLDLQAQRGNNWNIGLTYLHYQSNFMDYEQKQIRQKGVVPGFGPSRGISVLASNYYNFFAHYQAKRFFDFELGYGRQFIGDGYRSLLLSDNTPASPYLKINTRFWKFKYTNLFGLHQDIFNVEGKPSLYRQKFTASHFLDWEVTPWLQLGLFETIVWQADEGKYKRGFDPNYLNPIIFYRPVEFSVGSSDNALVGANIKFSLPRKHVLYFQAILDEFLLSEIQADFSQWRNQDQDIRSGWWANKYGIQLGWRKFDCFGIEGLESRLEYNFVRPYTYAHSSPTQAYSSYNLSLAHPLGANFEEILARFNYKRGDWFFAAHLNYSEQGISPLGTNFGENLESSNTSRIKEYENRVSQGLFQSRFITDLSLAYVFQKKWNALVSMNFRYQQQKRGKSTEMNNMVYLTLKTNLYQRYFDY